MSTKFVGGVFSTVEEAERAIRELNNIGFTKDDISVFAKDSDQVNNLEDDTDMDITTDSENRGKNSGKGAGLGALSGGVLGGIVGLIAETALLTIPGIGPLAAAGPLATTLAGLGTGAVGGGIVGALVGAGIPEDQAKEYEAYLEDGKIIVLVEADESQQDSVYRTFTDSNSLNTSMYEPDNTARNDNDINRR